MSENKPIEKEEIINGEENLSIEPELETEESSDEGTATEIIDPASDDSGGSTPPPEKGRG
jgi:hypothetical protein